ncbi:MAG: division/cell wall cluster transcriptional repressor MraZ [Syntrophotaleaceae bacterium]
MNFQGEFNNAIDAKGRASIPARFREILAQQYGDERLIVTQNRGGLVAFPVPEWDKFLENVQKMPPGQAREDVNLTLISPAVACTFDKQGRIQLSKALRDYSGLDGDVREIVVVGSFNKILVWNRAKHAEMRRSAEARLESDPQTLFDLGF